MPIQINRVPNARVYIDGNDFIGKAEEVELPSVKAKLGEVKGLGLYGETELPTGIDKMEAKFKFNGVYPELLSIVSKFKSAHTAIVRSSMEVWESDGIKEEKPVKAELRGFFKESPSGKFKARDNGEQDVTMAVNYYKLDVDNKTILEVDVLNNIYKVDGEDQLTEYKNNIGGN